MPDLSFDPLAEGLEALYAKLPPCRHCGSRRSRDAGSRPVFQRRRCLDCGQTYRVPPVGWVRWRSDGTPLVIPA